MDNKENLTLLQANAKITAVERQRDWALAEEAVRHAEIEVLKVQIKIMSESLERKEEQIGSLMLHIEKLENPEDDESTSND
jgi:hypothetical protein